MLQYRAMLELSIYTRGVNTERRCAGSHFSGRATNYYYKLLQMGTAIGSVVSLG